LIGSVLIANRGEIARRVIRTARRLGVRTIAVYSAADAAAPHVREADEAVAIGPSPARDSYLKVEAILAAAKATGAEAIHPGYGFLSENADFAEAVMAAGLVWVGPPPAAIRAMGLKDAAKRLMAEAGVPVTPGYLGEDQSPKVLAAEAARIGFPVLIKAVAGGGGKGMRRVGAAEDFAPALEGARREAASAFGDERVLLERYVTRPRHIEVQVFGDAQGNVVHLFERDCSLQRRHQKVIEEAPAPGIDAATRAAITSAAVRAAKAVGYQNAGTIEFIADASEGLKPDRVWFMEMNTRLQVEHPVTEAVTGLDLVEWQLRVASGEPLPLAQDQIRLSGHAVEARLYAEDAARGFLPSIGTLAHLQLPSSVRVDSGVEAGGEVTSYYDPMIAKLIAHAETREAAIERLGTACAKVEVWPVTTNAGFLTRLLAEPEFRAGQADTGFIEPRMERLTAPARPSGRTLKAAAGALASPDDRSPWTASGLAGLRLGQAPAEARLQVGAEVVTAPIAPEQHDALRLKDGAVVFEGGQAFLVARPHSIHAGEAEAGDGQVVAPMPGRIASVAVIAGETVTRGQTLATLEAMKMEHALIAAFDATVTEVRCAVGDQVTEGALLLRLEAAEPTS
jgi:propionyl-CoA carboxylase alpha chain/3-methylcrotonyl-CoA carboxylase alpha subunit